MSKETIKNKIQPLVNSPSLGYTDNFPKREMWREIAREYDGEFIIKHNSSYELEAHNISIPYKKWTLRISVSDTKPLKFQISFFSIQEFEFSLNCKDFLDKIIEKFSKSNIKLGYKEFDKRYHSKSNKADLMTKIITKDIQETLLKYNVYSISYQADSNLRTAELMSIIQRRAGDKRMIIDLIEMYKSLINNLEKFSLVK